MTERKKSKQTETRTGSSAEDLSDLTRYILLPGRSDHGTFSYPDTLVEKTLSHRGKSWYGCHQALHQEGNFMLTIRQFVDLLSLLRSEEAVDGTGKRLSSGERKAFFDDYSNFHPYSEYEPRVGERLDARFTSEPGRGFSPSSNFHMNYNSRLNSNGEVESKKKQIGSSGLGGLYYTFFCTEEYTVRKIPGTIVTPFDEYLQAADDTGLLPAKFELNLEFDRNEIHRRGLMYFTSMNFDDSCTACFYFPGLYDTAFYGHIMCLEPADSERSAIGVRRAREK